MIFAFDKGVPVAITVIMIICGLIFNLEKPLSQIISELGERKNIEENSSETNLPIFLVLTHGHCDHAGGAAYFDDVYLSEADWDLVEYHASMDIKTDYVNYCSPDIYKKLTGDDFCPVRTNGYKPLQNGQIFDLGGIKLEAVAVPGHTQGMTCILNEKERWILFGDACNPSVFLWGEGSLSVEEYRESLCNLKKYEERYDTVLRRRH